MESNDKSELTAGESKFIDEHDQDTVNKEQMDEENNLIELTKDNTKHLQEAGTVSDLVKDEKIEASVTCLETKQAEVLSAEPAIDTDTILEVMDSTKSEESKPSLDSGEQEIQIEASSERCDVNGTNSVQIVAADVNGNVVTIDACLPNSAVTALSEKDNNNDESKNENGEAKIIESEQACTSIADVQVDNSEVSESLDEIEKPKSMEKLDNCENKDSDIEEISALVTSDDILNSNNCLNVANVDSNQDSTDKEAISIETSDTAAVEVIDKATIEIDVTEEGKDAENKATDVDYELKPSQTEPDNASSMVNVSTECNSSKEIGDVESLGQEVEVGVDISVQEDASSEFLTDGKTEVHSQIEGDVDGELQKVDTDSENAVTIQSESVVEKQNDCSVGDKIADDALASTNNKVDVGEDVLAVEDNSNDQSLNIESQKQDQDKENDLGDSEIVEIKTEVALEDVELPENGLKDDTNSLVECQNVEICKVLNTEVLASQEVKLVQLANDEEKVETGVDNLSKNVAQSDSDVADCQIVNLSENDLEVDANTKTMEEDVEEEEEDEGEGLSFDFDDLEMEAAIAQSLECKNADEEFEVGVEVLADEANLEDEMIDKTEEVHSQNADNAKRDCDLADNMEGISIKSDENETLESASLLSPSEISQEEIEVTPEQATIVQGATRNSSENNNTQSSPTESGSYLVTVQSQGLPKSGKNRAEMSANVEQAPLGKKSKIRLRKLVDEREKMIEQVKKLKAQLEQKTQKNGTDSLSPDGEIMENGNDPALIEMQRDANRQMIDLKFKLVKAEQEATALEQNVTRLEGQVARYKSASENAEKVEDELKAEKRKLQREVSQMSM
ncbi:hypothetical protein WMY93_001718 [Mugilogobius chulae]|uniref:Uncharacterized protein n=1 Tax=Mugilogobius chulae TaxID=88201 RepID=A0AAW0Q1B7_9GOBI